MGRTVGVVHQELPPAGIWDIDPRHTRVGFCARHLGRFPVRGRFTVVSGQVEITEDLPETTVDVTILASSVSTGWPARDDALRSADHLDVARHPTAAFRSIDVSLTGPRAWLLGELTILGVTNRIGLAVTYHGTVVDPRGDARVGFSAAGTIDREDWGLAWDVTLEGGRLIGPLVAIEVDVQAVLR